jgi:hypothetical protein
MLDVPAELLRYLSRLLAAERRRRGTPARSRRLTCRDQALLALRWFRDRTRIDRLATDHAISRATAYRYVAEAVGVLSARAPGLDEALERALADGAPYVVLDGKIFETDRLAETVTSAKGEESTPGTPGRSTAPARTSRPSPADSRSVHRRPNRATSTTSPPPAPTPCPCSIPPPQPECRPSPTAATKEPESASTPRSRTCRETSASTRTPRPGTLLRGLRSQGERGFAPLTQRWATLQRITASPRETTDIVRAAQSWNPALKSTKGAESLGAAGGGR